MTELANTFAKEHNLLVEVSDYDGTLTFTATEWPYVTVTFYKQSERGQVAGKKLGITE